jgi:hypothetical protein
VPWFFAVASGSLSLVGVPVERLDDGQRYAPEIPAGLVPFWIWARREPPAGPEEWASLARGYRLRWSVGFDLSLVLRAFLCGNQR